MALRTLISINVVFYLAWVLVLGSIPVVNRFVWNHLALNPELPGVLLEAWQVVTYNFLHLDGFLHVLFNMLWLWWIGREFEDLHGPAAMLSLYVLGGVGGGVLSVVGYSLSPGSAVIHGASASVLALMTAVVTLYPQKRIGLFLFGAVRLLWVVLVFIGLDLLRMLGPTDVAVLAHLGGAAAGFLFAKAQRGGVDVTSWAKVFFSGRSRSSGGYAPGRSAHGGSSAGGGVFGGMFGGGGSSASGGAPTERETLRQERDRKKRQQNARRREVDRILDKISAKGWDGLTDEEKRTLEDASGQ